VDENDKTLPKLDERGVYELLCFVSKSQDPARKACPPKQYWSEASEPFRLAAPFDPDGTKNRTISITSPDFRRLAARAGSKQGPGGLRITTPPESALSPFPVADLGKTAVGTVGPGGSVCTFAIELLFIVAFFLFSLFLPIVIFAFQLWWMLALKFCFPPSASFGLLADFFNAGKGLPDLAKPENKNLHDSVDDVLGLPGGVDALITDPKFKARPSQFEDLVATMNPSQIVAAPVVPMKEKKPLDPLCENHER
jgi:hypothetical protein